MILTRHYKTRTNQEGRILGWGDSPPGDDWKSDIDYIDARLREHGVQFDAAYSSDLERSRRTTMIHAENLGIETVESAPELNEVHYGELQKKKKSSVAELFPQHKLSPDLVYPRGESFRQMQQRSLDYLLSVLTGRAGQTILVVSHAGVIRGIVSHFLGLEYAENLKRRIPFRYIGDFLFDGTRCIRYDELGKLSGFVRDNVIEIPFSPGAVS
ncbi:MAG: histidine phosphatase family protein [Gammaproteobacteria bacterium]|nr:histidine phosphatase family protein [Gammaproteobacteria bacterium]MDH3449979.1 histidine phosphatase family protein [Gammaproteobacteria bacterium]